MKLQRAVYETRRETVIDFLAGVGIFLGLNLVLATITVGLSYLVSQNSGSLDQVDGLTSLVNFMVAVFYCCPYLLNIGLMIYFGMTRYWIALGMLGTFAGLLLLVVIAGVLFAIWCFYALSTGGFGP